LLIYDALYDFSRVPHNPAPLSAVERAHSERVAAHIREFVASQGGVIGFDAYMRLALYSPAWATTAPVPPSSAAAAISSPRRKCRACSRAVLARQAAEILQVTGGDILELGAGLGTMAADVLLELRRSIACRRAIASSK
jgi:hypothetical protein